MYTHHSISRARTTGFFMRGPRIDWQMRQLFAKSHSYYYSGRGKSTHRPVRAAGAVVGAAREPPSKCFSAIERWRGGNSCSGGGPLGAAREPPLGMHLDLLTS